MLEYLNRQIRPHLSRWEEVVFPVVDQNVGGGVPFTTCLRREHAILRRRIDEWESDAGVSPFDTFEFTRKIHGLIGILEAHLEVEHEIVLPLFDRVVTPEELRARGEKLLAVQIRRAH